MCFFLCLEVKQFEADYQKQIFVTNHAFLKLELKQLIAPEVLNEINTE